MSGSYLSEELNSDSGGSTLNIKVFYELNDHDVSVPSDYTFGSLKSVIVGKLGLDLQKHKILFRGREKEDGEHLLTAGIKNGSKVVLIGDLSRTGESPEEARETSVVSKGSEAVSLVREEVDKLSEQVSALECVVNGGTQLDDKDFIYLTEMLMRQLLKLDGIEAEGEGRVQRKSEVSRLQRLVDKMDHIRSRNSNPVGIAKVEVSNANQWETFEPESVEKTPAATPVILVPDNSPTDTLRSAASGSTPASLPYSSPPSEPFFVPDVASPAIPYSSPVVTSHAVPAPYYTPADSTMPPSSQPCSTPPSMQSSIPFPPPYYNSTLSAAQVHFVPYMVHAGAQSMQYYVPAPGSAMPNPYHAPPANGVPPLPVSAYVVPVPIPVPWNFQACPAPPPPPSTNVTQDWEHFE